MNVEKIRLPLLDISFLLENDPLRVPPENTRCIKKSVSQVGVSSSISPDSFPTKEMIRGGSSRPNFI